MAQPAAGDGAEGADAQRAFGVDGRRDVARRLDGEFGGEIDRGGEGQAQAEAGQPAGGCWIEGDAHAMLRARQRHRTGRRWEG